MNTAASILLTKSGLSHKRMCYRKFASLQEGGWDSSEMRGGVNNININYYQSQTKITAFHDEFNHVCPEIIFFTGPTFWEDVCFLFLKKDRAKILT